MKALKIVVVLLSFTLGAFAGKWYQTSQQAFKSEEIIGKEIVLLEKFKNIPTCKDVLDADKAWGTVSITDGIIVWRYEAVKASLQKVIVDRNMTSAHEDIIFSGSEEKSN